MSLRREPQEANRIARTFSPLCASLESCVATAKSLRRGSDWRSSSKDGQNVCVWRRALFLGVCSKVAKIRDELWSSMAKVEPMGSHRLLLRGNRLERIHYRGHGGHGAVDAWSESGPASGIDIRPWHFEPDRCAAAAANRCHPQCGDLAAFFLESDGLSSPCELDFTIMTHSRQIEAFHKRSHAGQSPGRTSLADLRIT
jgi:hypothetical protein